VSDALAWICSTIICIAILIGAGVWIYIVNVNDNAQRIECLRQQGSPLNTSTGWTCVQIRK
jgi:hypothetical protein